MEKPTFRQGSVDSNYTIPYYKKAWIMTRDLTVWTTKPNEIA